MNNSQQGVGNPPTQRQGHQPSPQQVQRDNQRTIEWLKGLVLTLAAQSTRTNDRRITAAQRKAFVEDAMVTRRELLDAIEQLRVIASPAVTDAEVEKALERYYDEREGADDGSGEPAMRATLTAFLAGRSVHGVIDSLLRGPEGENRAK